jgi:hypothetical protein
MATEEFLLLVTSETRAQVVTVVRGNDDGVVTPPAPNAPTDVTCVSAASDTTPDFSMTLPGALAGDEVVGQYSADGAGVWSSYFSHTLTAPEILAGTITISGLTPLAAGAWDFRFRTERAAEVSAWSSTVDVTITSSVPPNAYITSFQDTSTKTAGQSYTVTGASIGTPHADRVFVLIIADSGQPLGTPTVGGVAMTAGPVNTNLKAFYLETAGTAVEASATADLAIPNTSGVTCGYGLFSTFVCYPASATPVDSGAAQAGTTIDAVISGLDVVPGGFVAYTAMAVGGATNVLWSGSDAVSKDYDTTFETLTQHAAGHIAITQTGSFNLTFQESATGSKRIAAFSFGAPA